jgi:hypothetical protein
VLEDHPIHEWLLSPEGVTAVREAMREKHPWLVHNLPLSALSGVRERGLLRREPGVLTTPNAILSRLGERPQLLCLAPPRSLDPWANLQQHSGPFFKLGVASGDLHCTLGLDWSFPHSWNLAACVARDSPDVDRVQVFLRVVQQSNVVAYHGDVAPEFLRVWTKGRAIDRPGDWPLLGFASVADFETWEMPRL